MKDEPELVELEPVEPEPLKRIIDDIVETFSREITGGYDGSNPSLSANGRVDLRRLLKEFAEECKKD